MGIDLRTNGISIGKCFLSLSIQSRAMTNEITDLLSIKSRSRQKASNQKKMVR